MAQTDFKWCSASLEIKARGSLSSAYHVCKTISEDEVRKAVFKYLGWTCEWVSTFGNIIWQYVSKL